MSKSIIEDNPMLLLPSLAVKVGLNEAIFIQQLHYWQTKSMSEHDGHKWVYNSYEAWQEQFVFWSQTTVRRVIANLEKSGLIITGNYNRMKNDKTKWYRVNYELLESMGEDSLIRPDKRKKKRRKGEETVLNFIHEQPEGELDEWPDDIPYSEQTPIKVDFRADLPNHPDRIEAVQPENIPIKGDLQDGLPNHPDRPGKFSFETDQHGHQPSTNCSGALSRVNKPLPEITSEKKEDVEKDRRGRNRENPYTFFEQNGFGTIGGYMNEKITAWCKDLSEELVIEAMKLAVEYGSKNWKYVEAILRFWSDKGYKTEKEVNADRQLFKEKRKDKFKDLPIKVGRDIPDNADYDIDSGEGDDD